MLRAEYDGRTVVSTELGDDEWAELRRSARNRADARLLSPITHDPMMCVEHESGLRFFRVFKGGNSGVGADESEHHIRMKSTAYTTAKRLGFEATVEQPADDGSWIADVMVKRPGARPLAIEIQWSKQSSDEFRRRTDRYSAAGIDCIWLDAGIDYRTVERDCWGGRADAETCYGNAWSGIEPSDGVIRLPVSRENECVRYDGAWHTVEETVEDLLGGRLRPDVLPRPEIVVLKDVRCPVCGRVCVGWKLDGSPFLPRGMRRDEELYSRTVERFLARVGRVGDCCSVQSRTVPGGGGEYRAFCCPRCNGTIAETLLASVGAGVRLAVPGMRTIEVMRSDGMPDHEAVYPSDFGTTTFGRLMLARGCTASTRSDVAMSRMRLLGWRMGADRRPPSIGSVREIKSAARWMVRRDPSLASSSEWWSSAARVGCGGVLVGLSGRRLSSLPDYV